MRYVILGGGGFGLEVCTYLIADIQSGRLPSHIRLALLDDSPTCEVSRRLPALTHLGRTGNYQPQADDLGLIAVGTPLGRLALALWARRVGLRLGRYIHPTAWVAPNATLGDGVVVCPHAIISAFACVQNNVAINVHAGVGHGAYVGEHTVMGPYSVINGDTRLGEGCQLGTRASLYPKVSLGSWCTVQAHHAVRRSCGDFQVIASKPAEQLVEDRITRMKWQQLCSITSS